MMEREGAAWFGWWMNSCFVEKEGEMDVWMDKDRFRLCLANGWKREEMVWGGWLVFPCVGAWCGFWRREEERLISLRGLFQRNRMEEHTVW